MDDGGEIPKSQGVGSSITGSEISSLLDKKLVRWSTVSCALAKASNSSETTLNYWMMVERFPNLKEDVGGSMPGSEISSLLHRKLARWSTASCVLAWHVNLLF